MGWEAGKKSTKPREMKGEIDGTWPASKAILHSSMPSWEQRAMSHHCNFGFLTVIPLILIFQACYLCLIPLFPNNRQISCRKICCSRGEKQDCLLSSSFPLGGNRHVPASHPALKKAEPQTVTRHPECEQSRTPSPHTQRVT